MSGTGHRGRNSGQGGGIWQTEEFVFGLTGGLGTAPRRRPRAGTAEFYASRENREDLQPVRSFIEFVKLSGAVARIFARKLWLRAERSSYRLVGDRLGKPRKILWPSAIVRWAWRNQRLRRADQVEGWHRAGGRPRQPQSRAGGH